MNIKGHIDQARELLRNGAAGNGDFVRRRRYRLSLVNLSSLGTVFEFRARRWGMALAGAGLFVVIGLVWLAAFFYTPLRNLAPVRMQQDLRDEYAALSARLDSANRATAVNDRYAKNIISILNGEGDSAMATAAKDVAKPMPLDSLMVASESERSFVRRFEDAERYNLSVLSPIAAEGMVFYRPANGAEVQERVSDSGIPSVVISGGKSMPVSAIYRGTVVSTYFTTGKGITVIVQHPNEFVSIYSGLVETFVARGEKVSAGTRLGEARSAKYPLMFELWHNGAPLPPAEYIIF